MLDAWAVADTEGHLLGHHEGSLEEAHAYAQTLAPPGARVFLDGMREVYEEAEPPELATAANITRAQRTAQREKRLRVLAPETPIEQQPALAAAALGFDGPIAMDEVLALSVEDAHAQIHDFFTDLPMHSGKVSRRWDNPLSAVEGMLGGNYKMDKRDPRQARARTTGLSIAPNVLAFRGSLRPRVGETVCLRSTPECRATCLVYTGQNGVGEYANALKVAKTKAFLNEPVAFLRLLHAALHRWSCEALAFDYEPFVRLNVYSDIPWELVWPELFDDFPDVQFYDYTKVPGREIPENYDLTFSYSGRNHADTLYEVGVQGRRVAAVFLVVRGGQLPTQWSGLEVVDGEISDLRPLDPPNAESPDPVCVGLRYKPPSAMYSRAKPIRGRDVFVVPCELNDDGTVTVAIGQRHTLALEQTLKTETA